VNLEIGKVVLIKREVGIVVLIKRGVGDCLPTIRVGEASGMRQRCSLFCHVALELGRRHSGNIFKSVVEAFPGIEPALPLQFLEGDVAIVGEQADGATDAVLVDERIEILAACVDGIGHVGTVHEHACGNVAEGDFLVEIAA
jgi:hypothetical protein